MKKKMCPNLFFDLRGYFEISVSEISEVDCDSVNKMVSKVMLWWKTSN